MTLLNTIILPFQAGCENIITAIGKPRELSVIKCIFKDNHYQYNLQSDNSLFSWQGRVSMFSKGVTLCLPFIGHITCVALRYFSSSIFLEMPLDFAIKCSSEQKLEVAKWLYISKPERVSETIRLILAKILANDEQGLNLLAANILYLGLRTDVAFSIEIIQKKSEVLGQISDSQFAEQVLGLLQKASSEQKLAIATFIFAKPDDKKAIDFTQKLFQINPIPEQIKQCFAKQILQQDSGDCEFIIKWFNSLNFNQTIQEEVIKELLCQMGSSSEQMQVAIAHTIIEKCPSGPNFLLDNIVSFEKAYIANNMNKFNLSEEQKNNLLEKCTTSVLV